MKTYNEFSQLIGRYATHFAKCNITASRLMELQNSFTITETCTKKENNRIIEKTTKTVFAEYYANIICGCDFFNSRITKSYTMAGYIAVRFFSRNPWNKSLTISRDFTFTYNR